MSYTTNDFIYIRTEHQPEDSTKDVFFEYLNFVYSVRCFENIIQFIKGQIIIYMSNYKFRRYRFNVINFIIYNKINNTIIEKCKK